MNKPMTSGVAGRSRSFVRVWALGCAWLVGVAGPLAGATVAIYNDVGAGYDPATGEPYYGVWQPGVTAIEHMLDSLGWSHEQITYEDLNTNAPLSQLYPLFWRPLVHQQKFQQLSDRGDLLHRRGLRARFSGGRGVYVRRRTRGVVRDPSRN